MPKLKKCSGDEVSRAGYDYANECWSDCLDYFDKCPEEVCCSEPAFIPNILSSNMPQVFDLLLKYGLDPNAVCEGETVLSSVSSVYNEYIAADTLALLMEHGGIQALSLAEKAFLIVSISISCLVLLSRKTEEYTIPLFIAGLSCLVIGPTPAATNHWMYSHGAA